VTELNPHEEAVVRHFFLHHRRLEFLHGLSGTSNARYRTVNLLCHFVDFVAGTASPVPVAQQDPETIYRLLRRKGAPPVCHVISEGDLDGRDIDLRQAIEETFDPPICSILSCIPGELAYYQGEYDDRRLILERPKK
jgi:hypothetical protein